MSGNCAVPGCKTHLSRWNVTGVCKSHNHATGYCGCKQCRSGKVQWRIRTREELVADGLLPDKPIFFGTIGANK